MSRVSKESAAIRRQYGIPNLMKAVRDDCLCCMGGSRKEVKLCTVMHCPLWPYRFGRNPKPEDIRVPRFNSRGDVIGYDQWAGYMQREE